MKILLITPFPPPMGGIANWSKLVYDYLSENTSDVEVRYINTAPKKRSADGRTIFNRIFGGFISIIKCSRMLKKEIKTFKPDVVHINTSGSLALFRDIKILKILKRKNIRTILHLRFGRVPDVLKTNSLESKLLKKAFNLTKVILCIDQKTTSSVSILYPDKTKCIPNPFVAEKMPSVNGLTIDKCSNEITFLGWVVKTKGIEELLSAWKEIYLKYPTWKLKVIGPYNDSYLDTLKNNFSFDGVFMLGEKSHDDAMEIVNNSDIFVLPSYTEGFPNVILEAMYLGKAIVSTDVGAIPEMLADDCGIVIKPQCVEELVISLEKVITDASLRVKLGNNASKKCEIYSIDNVLKQYMEIWFK